MKQILCLGFLFGTFYVQAQQLTPVLGPLIPVTPTNTTGNTRPRITLVGDSIPLVVWTKVGSGNSVVYSARWNGVGFDTAVPVSPAGVNVYSSEYEGGDVASLGDTVFVVFFTTTNKVYSVRSVDGGQSWQDTVRIDHAVANMSYTPDVQILPGGNPIVVFEGADATMNNAQQLVSKSMDGGQTYSLEMDAHLGVTGTPCECCPPALLVKDTMVYVLYRNNDNNVRNIVMTISSDTGNTFPVVSEIDQTNWTIFACPSTGPEAMFYQDSVVAVWKSGNKIYFGCGNALNGSAGTHQLLEPSLSSTVAQKHASICGNGDTIVYTWADRRNNNYDVFVAVSSAGPVTISQPVMFNDTIGFAENGTQHNAHAVFQNGIVHLIYADAGTGLSYYRRATVTSPNGINESSVVNPVQIFPSPAVTSFSYSSATIQSAAVRIYSVSGALVASYIEVESEETMDCATLATGIYSVVITDNNGVVYTSQLVKQ